MPVKSWHAVYWQFEDCLQDVMFEKKKKRNTWHLVEIFMWFCKLMQSEIKQGKCEEYLNCIVYKYQEIVNLYFEIIDLFYM